MADDRKRISELNSAGTLTGAEIVPVVQSGSTVKTLLSAIKTFINKLYSNGLTESAGTVKLGGTLSENTTISTNQKDFYIAAITTGTNPGTATDVSYLYNFSDATDNGIGLFSVNTPGDLSSWFRIRDGAGNIITGTNVIAQAPQKYLEIQLNGSDITLKTTDPTTNKFKFDGDYSGGYENRSIPDVAYVQQSRHADFSLKPVSLADTAAQNNSVYFSTTQNKLVYKDAGGNVNVLY